MRVKVVILDNDEIYISRLLTKFTNSYPDKLEVHACSEFTAALKLVHEIRAHVLLAGMNIKVDTDQLPQWCGFAYLVDSADITSYLDQNAIGKYQKADIIYREILSIFYDVAPKGLKLRAASAEEMRIITFMPCSGGVGSSTAAAACAKALAATGESVLYLNIETNGLADAYFTGEGVASFSDIITALKLKRSNLTIKIESALRTDPSGVSFFSSPKHALDIREFNAEDAETLLNNLTKFKTVIIDSDLGTDGIAKELMKLSTTVVLVGDGSATSNIKLERLIDTLSIMDENENTGIISKIMLLYNKLTQRSSTREYDRVGVLGTIQAFNSASEQRIVDLVASSGAFSKLCMGGE